MSPELLNTYVDWLFKALGIFILICLGISFLVIFFDWVKEKLAKKKNRRILKDEHYQELVDAANRKTQVVNRQIQSLDKCSKEIETLTQILNNKTDSFINILQEKLLQYKDTASLLKGIDESIHQSVQTLQENPLMNKIEERLTEILRDRMNPFTKELDHNLSQYKETTNLLKEIDGSIINSVATIQNTGIENLNQLLTIKNSPFIHFIQQNLADYKRTANLLQRVDNNIHTSASNIGESAILLEKRDRELKEEINCLLSLEGKSQEDMDHLIRKYRQTRKNKYGLCFNYELELSFYLDYPIDVITMPTVGKRVLKEYFKCETLEDVLSVMLLHQKKGLYKIKDIGGRSIMDMEDYFIEIGLLEIKNKKFYTSKLCIPGNIA